MRLLGPIAKKLAQSAKRPHWPLPKGRVLFRSGGEGPQPKAKHEGSMFENAPPRAGDVRALAHQLLNWADHLSDRPDPARELTEEGRHDLILGLALATREARRLR